MWGGDCVEGLIARISQELNITINKKWAEVKLFNNKHEPLNPSYSLAHYFEDGSSHDIMVGCEMRGGGKERVKKHDKRSKQSKGGKLKKQQDEQWPEKGGWQDGKAWRQHVKEGCPL